MLLTNKKIRNLLLFIYLIISSIYSIYMFSIKKMYSTIENGHLNWNFFKINIFVWLIWLFFFCFSFFYEKRYIPLIFALCILVISYINYKNYHSVGTKWCWLANSLMIYYAIYLLLYLPFKEKNKIC
jgi:cell division protein FtsW (lipid II flippase)